MPHIVSSKQDLGYASSGTGSCSILDQIGTHANFNQNEKVRQNDNKKKPARNHLNYGPWLSGFRFPTTHDWWPI